MSQRLGWLAHGPLAPAVLVSAAFWMLIALAPSAVQALTITIPDNAVLGVDALKLNRVGVSSSPLSYGQYRVDLVPGSFQYVPFSPGETQYQNQVGQRIRSSYNVTFGAFDGDPDVNVEYMLVFTSVYVIPSEYIPASGLTCGELSPSGWRPAKFDYVPDAGGFTGGDIDRIITTEDSASSGQSQVCNALSSTFTSSLVFQPILGESESTYQFTMDISQTEAGITTTPYVIPFIAGHADVEVEEISDLKFLVQGYSAVPEPNTALMLLLGLAGLHHFSKHRKTLG